MRTNLIALIVAGFAAVNSSHLFAADATPPVDEPVVGLFDAEEAGQIEIQFIPKNATQATVLIRNKTEGPLRLQLPDAFAAVPAHAQMGMDGGMGMGMDGGMGGMGGGMQAMGGGMGMMGGMGGMGMGGMGMGMGGMMRIAPEKQGKVKVPTVCLEHGKRDPNPRVEYKMVRAESFISDPRVVEICRLLGMKKLTQNIAQAAAWHLTDNLSWPELAAKNRIESKYTGNVRWFHPRELHFASMLVADTNRLLEDADSDASRSDYDGN